MHVHDDGSTKSLQYVNILDHRCQGLSREQRFITEVITQTKNKHILTP